MEYKYARYDSLLNKISNKDLLFNGNYTIDPYQNCEFGCKYCDSALNNTVYIKTNAAMLLKKEIKKIEKGTIVIGSVHDPYQKTEKKHETTRSLLKIIRQYDFPCHILTKSNMILRDIDILTRMNTCLVTISMTTFDETALNFFEKKLPPPKKRMQTMKILGENGIKTGLAIMPILPFIVDNELEKIVRTASEHNADYVLHKHLELKGDQKTIFMKTLKKFKPDLIDTYKKLYCDNYIPNKTYRINIKNTIKKLCKDYKIKERI